MIKLPRFPFSTARLIRMHYVAGVFAIMATLMILSAVLGYYNSKSALKQLLEDQSHHLLETLLSASRNSLLSTELSEEILIERLLNNAYFIRSLYEKGEVNDQLLQRIAKDNHLFRINIFTPEGEKRFSSHRLNYPRDAGKFHPAERLAPIFSGRKDTLLLGIKDARFEDASRFIVAVATAQRHAIVLNLDAEGLLRFRNTTGYGAMLQQLSRNDGIVYAALQDTAEILAATSNVDSLEYIQDSPFLSKSLCDSSYGFRFGTFHGEEIFEAVHPFSYRGQTVGLLRLGVSLSPLQAIWDDIYQQVIVITAVIILAGSILITLFVMGKNLESVQQEYREIESYATGIVENVSDGIIVLDHQEKIKLINSAAGKLFGRRAAEVTDQSLHTLLGAAKCRQLLHDGGIMQEIDCRIGPQTRQLLVSRSYFYAKDGQRNTILVLRDLTEQKTLEAQIQRKERLSAMGELASGVAHEIRNPLNTIGAIVQQLDKDFEPARDAAEYHELARLVYGEVQRINQTVKDFLRFSRPEPLQPERFRLSALLNQLRQQYQAMAAEKQIRYHQALDWDGEVYWDRRQIQQMLMNLIENALDALPAQGEISLRTAMVNTHRIMLEMRDNGPGIPAPIRGKIFNLYFTTKAKGTGIGLSLVQRIVDEHGGVITVESAPESGTMFRILLPLEVVNDTQNSQI